MNVMDYEEYLEKFCMEKTFWKRAGDMYSLTLPRKIRLKVKRLEKEGYLVRLTVDYHYHSVYPDEGVKCGKGFGFVRIHKYLPNAAVPAGVEIEEGAIGE